MILKTIILFCIFYQTVFASVVQDSSLGPWQTSWQGLPVELHKKIISHTRFPYCFAEVNKHFYGISQQLTKNVIEKNWDLEYKFHIIYQDCFQLNDEKRSYIPWYLTEYFNTSHPFFQKSIPFFIYYNTSVTSIRNENHPFRAACTDRARESLTGPSNPYQHFITDEEISFDVDKYVKNFNLNEENLPKLHFDNYFSNCNCGVVGIRWNTEDAMDYTKENQKNCEAYLNNLLELIKMYKKRIICINLDIKLDVDLNENNSYFLSNYLKKLSKECTISVNAPMRLFCIYHNIPVLLPGIYYRKKHIFDPLVQGFFESQKKLFNTHRKEGFLNKYQVQIFGKEQKSMDDWSNFLLLVDILNINNFYYHYFSEFSKFYLSPCEKYLLSAFGIKAIPSLLTYHLPLGQKDELEGKCRLIKNFNYDYYGGLRPDNRILGRTVKDVIKFGNEELIFDCYDLVLKKSPQAYSIILELLESLYIPLLLKKAGIKLIQDLKLNFLNIDGKKTSHDLRLRLYESLVDEPEINKLQEFKDLALSVVNYLKHLPQPWSLKNIKTLLSIIKKQNIIQGFIFDIENSKKISASFLQIGGPNDSPEYALNMIKNSIEENVFNDTLDYHQFILDCISVEDYSSSNAIQGLITNALRKYVEKQGNYIDVTKLVLLFSSIQTTEERKQIVELCIHSLHETKKLFELCKKTKFMSRFQLACIKRLIKINIMPISILTILILASLYLNKKYGVVSKIFSL